MGAGYAANAEPGWREAQVLGFSTGPNGIAFQVPTGGCLTKDDFAIRVFRQSGGPTLLQLLLAKADRCRMAVPYGKIIRFSYDEIGIAMGESFMIINTSGVVNRAGFAEIE
jgi:hypothetical protein